MYIYIYVYINDLGCPGSLKLSHYWNNWMNAWGSTSANLRQALRHLCLQAYNPPSAHRTQSLQRPGDLERLRDSNCFPLLPIASLQLRCYSTRTACAFRSEWNALNASVLVQEAFVEWLNLQRSGARTCQELLLRPFGWTNWTGPSCWKRSRQTTAGSS